jgi:hypothetical protein
LRSCEQQQQQQQDKQHTHQHGKAEVSQVDCKTQMSIQVCIRMKGKQASTGK